MKEHIIKKINQLKSTFHIIAVLLTGGFTTIYPVGVNISGRIFANSFLLIFTYLSYISFCISSCCFLWYFIIPISTTPMAAKNSDPNTAFLNAILRPDLKASSPPVTPPAMIWFMVSYLFRMEMSAQLEMEKRPAHRPKLPECNWKNYLRGWGLFSWGAWCHRRIVSFWGRATCLWWSRGCSRRHSPWRSLLRCRQRFGRGKVVIASSLLLT